MNARDKIVRIIKEQLGVKESEIKPEANFVDDLGADSLDAVEIVMAIEDEFGIEIPDKVAEEAKTVGDITNYINNILEDRATQ